MAYNLFHIFSHILRYVKYVDMLAHIFNTGQGVVTERSPHSDWVYFEAAYQQVFLFTCP